MPAPLPRPRWQRARGGPAALLARSVQWWPIEERRAGPLRALRQLWARDGCWERGEAAAAFAPSGLGWTRSAFLFWAVFVRWSSFGPVFCPGCGTLSPLFFISSLLAAAAHQGGGTRRRTAFPWDSFVLKTRARLAFVIGVFRSGNLSYTENPPARQDKIQRDFRTDPVLK